MFDFHQAIHYKHIQAIHYEFMMLLFDSELQEESYSASETNAVWTQSNDFTRLLFLSVSLYLSLSRTLSAFSLKVLYWNDCLTQHTANASIQMKNSEGKRSR